MEATVEAPRGIAVSLDILRAVREGQPAGHATPLAVRWAELEACADRLSAAHEKIHADVPGLPGFLALDWDAWGCRQAEQVAQQLARDTDTLLVLGMGGSALGARAIVEALKPGLGQSPSRHVEVLDTVDPTTVRLLCSRLDARRTAIVAVSKSGRTVETLALLRVLARWLRDAVGAEWSSRVAVVTGPGEGVLAGFASDHALATLPVPAEVGGRFSVLTAVGQLPAAYLGVDCEELRRGADAMKACVQSPGLRSNPAWQLAAIHHCWSGEAALSTLLIYCDRLVPFGRWFRQLFAESLGKRDPSGEAHGVVPVVGRGPADQHSQLQLWTEGPRNSLFTVLRVGDADLPGLRDGAGPADHLAPWLQDIGLAGLLDAERRGTTAALIDAGLPVVDLSVPTVDAGALGELFVLFETAVALLGYTWGIDPFDQPGVELAKRFAAALLGEPSLDSDRDRALSLLADPEEPK